MYMFYNRYAVLSRWQLLRNVKQRVKRKVANQTGKRALHTKQSHLPPLPSRPAVPLRTFGARGRRLRLGNRADAQLFANTPAAINLAPVRLRALVLGSVSKRRQVPDRRPLTARHSVERIPARWADELVKAACENWLQVARDHTSWKYREETIFSNGRLWLKRTNRSKSAKKKDFFVGQYFHMVGQYTNNYTVYIVGVAKPSVRDSDSHSAGFFFLFGEANP
ncbi:hypothetical protein EVAR_64565_1 [Eumeta japonica]|uniref:Uncharacterized protein n=1 Tax=Eumeta variegata TaxID=151549 RepID=A0A4C1ZEQ6_EUMVA|nr:hypothetical protein EVAR_64565_1 [Eumeta japonica]